MVLHKILSLGILFLFLTYSPAFSAEEPTKPVPDKIIFAFQKQKDPVALAKSTAEVAQILSEEIGIPVEIVIPASYGATVEALVSDKAHVAYLSSIPYILAAEETSMRILLAEVRDGRTDYDSIFVVHKDSPIQSLEELRGKRMAFTSATSTSGYMMPYARLVHEGFLPPGANPREFFSQISFSGGYDLALMAVHQKRADVCAVSYYTMEGPRADIYVPKEIRDELRVLERTSGVPTHLIGARGDLPEELITKLQEALLGISKERPDLLADVYGAAEFAIVDEETHLKGARDALKATNMSPGRLVSR